MSGNKERAIRNKGKKNTVLKVNSMKHKVGIRFGKPLKKKEKENG